MWLCIYIDVVVVFFFKQKTAYEMRISDWSSDVCSSDLVGTQRTGGESAWCDSALSRRARRATGSAGALRTRPCGSLGTVCAAPARQPWTCGPLWPAGPRPASLGNRRTKPAPVDRRRRTDRGWRSEEHTSELQSLMR